MSGAVLSAEIRRFAYDDDAAPSLRDVRVDLVPGSLLAVLGGSGSGKSTLAKILAGWALSPGHARLEGALELKSAGARLEFIGGPGDPRLRLGAWGERVAYVPQRPVDLLTGAAASVGEELAFSLEQRGVARAQMRALVREAAGTVGLEHLLERHPASLSGGEQRRLALGCVVVGQPDVVLLDEPTASLDAQGLESLVRLVDALLVQGVAVVVFGTAADRLALRAERWLLLGGGTVTAEGTPHAVLASEAFAAAGVLRDDPVRLESLRPAPVRCTSTHPAQPLAELDRVTFAYGPARGKGKRGARREPSSHRVLDAASLAACRGEILALTGPNGAGKSTALRHLAGLLEPLDGEVRVLGASICGRPAGRVAETVGTLFQDPRDQLFERTALREVSFGLGALGLAREDVADRALGALAAVNLDAKAHVHPYELAVSEQRLLAFATVLARHPRVLLLDEPTVGLDRFGLELLEAAVRDAAESGAAVVLSTHALGWGRRLADRVLTLDAGRFAVA